MVPPANSPRAAHCIASRASQPARAAHCIASRASQPARAAHCIASRAAHRIANNPRTVQRAARTDNQPAAHRPQRTAGTSHLQHCTRFAVLCAGFVWFVVLTFPKFNLNTLRIKFFHVFVVQLVLNSEI
jgi:ferric-dicitrate binding protein FerR (iron transport regulator)